jgi:dephospho-CoA kinase
MPESSRIVVGVAGRIGSGKTAVARQIEREFGFQYLRYSQILAEWCETDPADKVRLQSIGGKVMSGVGQLELNRRLIRRIDPARDAVVDGLRHPIDYESLHGQFGDRFFLIFVEAPPGVRFSRLRDRYSTFDRFRKADGHPVESHIDSLQPLAFVTLPGTLPGEPLLASLKSAIFDFREGMVA